MSGCYRIFIAAACSCRHGAAGTIAVSDLTDSWDLVEIRAGVVVLFPLIMIGIGIVGVLYSHFLYPPLLLLFPDLPRMRRARADWSPRLTLVIAARNEERRIREKLEESLELRREYPQLEIIVASDASTDGTDSIVEEYSARDVQLVRTPVRNGKEFAQRAAINASSGELLVFTDTGTTIVPDSMRRIAEIFTDETIGAVSSTDRLIRDDGTVSGEGLYIRYEMWLRDLESRKAGLIGLSGSFFAARRQVCDRWDTDIPSDFAVAITCSAMGLRAVSDRAVIGVYRDARDPDHEFARKVRTIIRGMSAVAKRRDVLNPFRFPLLSFQLLSHKILRWAVPWFWILLLSFGLLSVGRIPAVWLVLVPSLALMVTSVVGWVSPGLRNSSVVGAAYYYVQVNAAAFVASVQFLAGKRVTTWVPTTR